MSLEYNNLFKLVRMCEHALIRMGIAGDDYRLPHEVRIAGVALEAGEFTAAKDLLKMLERRERGEETFVSYSESEAISNSKEAKS